MGQGGLELVGGDHARRGIVDGGGFNRRISSDARSGNERLGTYALLSEAAVGSWGGGRFDGPLTLAGRTISIVVRVIATWE